MPRRPLLLAVLILLAVAPAAHAASQVFSGTGANANTQLQAFENTVGGSNNGATAGSQPSGFRTINWDGVPDALAEPHALPGDFFNTTSPRGVLLSTPGDSVRVSADDTHSPPLFADVNSTYSNDFASFSPNRIFSPLGSTVTDVRFATPGSSAPATVNAFGAIFTNVRLANSSSIEFFDPRGTSLGKFFVPNAAQQQVEFLGVLFNAGERVERVRITSGTTPLSGSTDDGGSTNVVAMDDFAYAEPQQLPGPTLVITNPGEGATINRGQTTVAGAASDPFGIASLTVNGQPVSVNPDGSWSVVLDLEAGANTITAMASNPGGASTTVQRTITAVPPPPKPSNKFTFGVLRVGRANGSAVVILPGPGRVDFFLSAARPVGRIVHLVRQATVAGPLKMRFKIPRRDRKILRRRHVHAAEKVIFTPVGGKSATRVIAVTIPR